MSIEHKTQLANVHTKLGASFLQTDPLRTTGMVMQVTCFIKSNGLIEIFYFFQTFLQIVSAPDEFEKEIFPKQGIKSMQTFYRSSKSSLYLTLIIYKTINLLSVVSN